MTEVVKDVRAIERGGGSRDLRVSDVVGGGATVRTGSDSRAEMVYSDGTLVRLGAGAVFSFAGGTRNFRLERGSLLLHAPKGMGGGSVATASTTAAISGTTILVGATPQGGFKFMVLEGSGEYPAPADKSGRRKMIRLGAGEMGFINSKGELVAKVTINLETVLSTSKLLNGFSRALPSMPLIVKAVNRQKSMVKGGRLMATSMQVAGMASDQQLVVFDIAGLQAIGQDVNPLATPPPGGAVPQDPAVDPVVPVYNPFGAPPIFTCAPPFPAPPFNPDDPAAVPQPTTDLWMDVYGFFTAMDIFQDGSLSEFFGFAVEPQTHMFSGINLIIENPLTSWETFSSAGDTLVLYGKETVRGGGVLVSLNNRDLVIASGAGSPGGVDPDGLRLSDLSVDLLGGALTILAGDNGVPLGGDTLRIEGGQYDTDPRNGATGGGITVAASDNLRVVPSPNGSATFRSAGGQIAMLSGHNMELRGVSPASRLLIDASSAASAPVDGGDVVAETAKGLQMTLENVDIKTRATMAGYRAGAIKLINIGGGPGSVLDLNNVRLDASQAAAAAVGDRRILVKSGTVNLKDVDFNVSPNDYVVVCTDSGQVNQTPTAIGGALNVQGAVRLNNAAADYTTSGAPDPDKVNSRPNSDPLCGCQANPGN